MNALDADDFTNPYQSPQFSQTPESAIDTPFDPSCQQGKRRQLFWMVALFAISGLASGLLPVTPRMDAVLNLGTGIAFALLILRWYECDRWERGEAPWRFFGPLMVIFPGPIVMVPVYLISTRGLRGLVATMKAALFFVFLITVGVLAENAIGLLDLV